MTALKTASGQHLMDEDWYGDDLGAARFVDCTFTDVDRAGAVLLAELHGADVDTSGRPPPIPEDVMNGN